MTEKKEIISMELMHALLKQIRVDISSVKDNVQDLKQGQIAIRDEIHGLKGDVLRIERSNAAIEVRLDRIEKQMGLVNA
ncbi:MAG: hypothetical protein GY950_34010 [bacterium]|nr:hypothetical protein [bacterium]